MKYCEAIGPLFSEMKETEDDLRKILVDPNFHVGSTAGPDAFMINFFDTSSLQQLKQFVDYSLPSTLFNLMPDKSQRIRITWKTDVATFQKDYFLSYPFFEGFNWDNVIVAGGHVVCALTQNIPVHEHSPYYGSDIDIFVYGLNEEKANEKIFEILTFLVKKKEEISGKMSAADLIVSNHSITLLGTPPFPHIQIIFRLYRFKSEVLIGFDIDSCCLGFDGKVLWAIPRFLRSLGTKGKLGHFFQFQL
jgi:hypothetical protein